MLQYHNHSENGTPDEELSDSKNDTTPAPSGAPLSHISRSSSSLSSLASSDRYLAPSYVIGSLLLVHTKLRGSLPKPVANLILRKPSRVDINASLLTLPTSR